MAAVTFLPATEGTGTGTRVPCEAGESLFAVARRAGIPITTACVGKASCGLCRVKIIAGESHLSPFNPAERKHLGNVYFINKLRLSCQAEVLTPDADITIELPPK